VPVTLSIYKKLLKCNFVCQLYIKYKSVYIFRVRALSVYWLIECLTETTRYRIKDESLQASPSCRRVAANREYIFGKIKLPINGSYVTQNYLR